MSNLYGLRTTRKTQQVNGGGFTLLELLSVLAIVLILAALVLPAASYTSVKKFDSKVDKITALLNLARQEAQGKGTYTWVVFGPSSGTQPGDLIVVALRSRDGTDPMSWGQYPNVVPSGVVELLAPPLTVSQVQLQSAGTLDTQVPSLPSPVGDSDNDLNSALQVTINVGAVGNLTFQKAIRYLPSGAAGNNNQAGKFIEFGLQLLHGSVVDARNFAVVRIDKASASVQAYRP